MQIKDKIIVVTGAGGGIGQGMARRFAADGAKHVICVDRDLALAQSTACDIGGTAIETDVGSEEAIAAMIARVEDEIGPIDIFCANAGILTIGGLETSNEDWQRIWDVNVMSQVWCARHIVPRMTARGGGYIVNTASAAGLLNQVGAVSYGVTKHASVGLSEWIALTHGDDGIKVSVLCPQAVRSAMTKGHEEGVAALDGMLEPADVAEAVVRAIEAETFLILPHPTVLDYMRAKTADYDRWLGGMRKLNRIYGDNI